MTTPLVKTVVIAATLLATRAALGQEAGHGQEAGQEAPREVPQFQLQQPALSAAEARPQHGTAHYAALAGLADFGLRGVEVGLEVALSVLLNAAAVGNPGYGLIGLVFAWGIASIALAAISPAINAAAVSFLGGVHGFGHRVGPLMATSYVSQLGVDAAFIYCLVAANPATAALVAVIGSALGSTAMGGAYALVSRPTSQASVPAIPQGPAIPATLPQGVAFRF